MKALTGSLLLALGFTFSGCGQVDEPIEAEEATVDATAACAAYLLDNPNFSGPLPPFPVVGAPPACINLPLVSQNRTSSFRLAGCKVRFFDGVNCTGASYLALTSGVMPLGFNNRASSLRFQ